MRIGFDLDGVLYDWHSAAYEYSMDFLGINVDINTFYIQSNMYPEMFWNNLIRIPFIYTKYGIRKELYKMLVALAKNHEIFYITHRPIEAKMATAKWMEYCKLPYSENTIFTNNKPFEVRKNNIKLFIDDDPKVIQNLDNVCKTIFVGKPWRKEYLDKFKNYVTHVLELPEKIREMI